MAFVRKQTKNERHDAIFNASDDRGFDQTTAANPREHLILSHERGADFLEKFHFIRTKLGRLRPTGWLMNDPGRAKASFKYVTGRVADVNERFPQ